MKIQKNFFIRACYGSNINALVLLILLNELRKKDQMLGYEQMLHFQIEFRGHRV